MTPGDIYTVASSAQGTAGNSGDGSAATSALLNQPESVAIDSSGDLFISDTSNNQVREVAASSGVGWTLPGTLTKGDIYTVAGSTLGTSGYTGDGASARSALFNQPWGLAFDEAGDLYVGDYGNNRLRVLDQATAPLPVLPNGEGVTLTTSSGSEDTFYPAESGACSKPYVANGTGGYCALPSVLSTLSYDASANTYSLTEPGLVKTFDAKSGRLIQESDPSGDILTIDYNTPVPGSGSCPSSASVCETVASASGRSLVLSSNSSGQITSVSDPMGRTWSYSYDGAGDLVSATDPMGRVTSYGYDSSNPSDALTHDIVSVTLPNGQPDGPPGQSVGEGHISQTLRA
ncbi:MAG: RHS repeat domain-containing protein [Acidimicrobiales bacterium]